MADTKISWCDKSWNPITGCSPASEGCKFCYAKRMATRLRGRYGYPKDNPFAVTLHPDKLLEPLKWKKPQVIFICSMGDWMHEDVPTDYIDEMLDVISACPQHIFLTLTKRPENLERKLYEVTVENPCRELGGGDYAPNLWLGVSVENQETANIRIPLLTDSNLLGWKKFVSYEPAIGPVDFSAWTNKINWLIMGGENGPGARPCDITWARSVRDQCRVAKIPFWFKGWGDWMLRWGILPNSFDSLADKRIDGVEYAEQPDWFSGNKKGVTR